MFDTDILWMLIPLAPFLLGGLAIWTRHQSKMADKQTQLGTDNSDHDLASQRMREEMKYLKDRVATLERIATDGHSTRELEHEIEQLKDH